MGWSDLVHVLLTSSSLWSGGWSSLSVCHARIIRQVVVGVLGRVEQFTKARAWAGAVTEEGGEFWEAPNNSYTEKQEWNLAYDLAVNHRIMEGLKCKSP